MFEGERLSVRSLAKHHIKEGYYAKSARCQDCAFNSVCDGLHINMIRDQGLSMLQPLEQDDVNGIVNLRKKGLPRIRVGASPQPAAKGLSGSPPPKTSVVDPLSALPFKRPAPRRTQS